MEPFTKIAYFYKTAPANRKKQFHNIFFYNNPFCTYYYVSGNTVIANYKNAYASSKVLEISKRNRAQVIFVINKAYQKHYKNCIIINSSMNNKVEKIINSYDGFIIIQETNHIVVLFETFFITAKIQNILKSLGITSTFAERKYVKQLLYEQGI